MCIQVGVLRGLGKTWHSSFAAAISYYIVAIPLEAFLAFKLDMGLFGLWFGQLIGLILHTSMQQYFISIHFGDWSAIAREAHKRL